MTDAEFRQVAERLCSLLPTEDIVALLKEAFGPSEEDHMEGYLMADEALYGHEDREREDRLADEREWDEEEDERR